MRAVCFRTSMYAGWYPGGFTVFGTFISEPFDVSIVDGNAVLQYACEEQSVVPLQVFREMVIRSQAAIAKHDAMQSNVVPIERLAAMRGKFIIAHGEAM